MNRLKHLNFSSANNNEQLGFHVQEQYSFASNISELHVCVDTLDDCLTILGNQLNQMNKFYVIICGDDFRTFTNHTTKQELVNYFQNDLLILLRRMKNVEELHLQFLNKSKSLIDGKVLQKYFINHMSKLNKLTFNIGSLVRFDNENNMPSNEDIKKHLKILII